jgi:EAL domain-containing protein (putative c-di-GMP-specific phosphodiesterase class I)
VKWQVENALVVTATGVEEIKHLASLGYQKFDQFQGIHVFRKPKSAV